LGCIGTGRPAIEQESAGVWGWRTPLSIRAAGQIGLARGAGFPAGREKISFNPRELSRYHQNFIPYQIIEAIEPARSAPEFRASTPARHGNWQRNLLHRQSLRYSYSKS
jgi:hypothetical protein